MEKKSTTTKEEIIKLISKGENNLTVISKKLNLAPSTVSKHLQDLEDNGIIRQKETHFKKWKYYELNPRINAEKARQGGVTISKVLVVSAITVLALGLSYLVYVRPHATSYVPISITDPPIVPPGTQSLDINYSGLSVQLNNTKWLYLNSSGRLDLMSLINKSQIIGLADITPRSIVSAIKFNITSASITIDNITYNVYVPTKEVETNLNQSINSTSSLLIDFSPTIATINAQNTTAFMLLSSLKAGIFPNPAMTQQINSPNNINRLQVTFPLTKSYGELFPQQMINVSVSQSLSINGGNIKFNVTLDNKGEGNITIMSMMIENSTEAQLQSYGIGGISPNSGPGLIGPKIFPNQIDSTNQVMVPVNHTYVQRHSGPHDFSNNSSSGLYILHNSSIVINVSHAYPGWLEPGLNSINITIPNSVNNIIISGLGNLSLGIAATQPISNSFMYVNPHPGINFIVDANGTLVVPIPSTIPEILPNSIGYTIVPDSVASFSYYGNPGIQLTNNSSYKLIILTNKGLIQANVTT